MIFSSMVWRAGQCGFGRSGLVHPSFGRTRNEKDPKPGPHGPGPKPELCGGWFRVRFHYEANKNRTKNRQPDPDTYVWLGDLAGRKGLFGGRGAKRAF